MAPELRSKKASAPATTKAKSGPTAKRKAADDASPVVSKKTKSVATDGSSKKSPKKSKTSKTIPNKEKVVKEATPDDEHPSSDENDEDQVLALAGVNDSDDEEEEEEEEEEETEVDFKAVYKEGQDVGQAPKTSKAVQEASKAGKGTNEEPGVVYVGRVPHGFFEHQMRQYFEQFGPINRLRLSRNKKTGASKHYAFIEFAEDSTAEIVAKTMDAYLLFGHILKVKKLAPAQVHESLWLGANKRFKTIPQNKLSGNRLKKPKLESQWATTISNENKKRTQRAQKLKEIGYEFEAPELKSVEQGTNGTAALGNGEEDVPKEIETPPKGKASKIEAAKPAEDDEVGDGIESLNGDLPVKKTVKVSKQNGAKGSKKTKKVTKTKKVKA